VTGTAFADDPVLEEEDVVEAAGGSVTLMICGALVIGVPVESVAVTVSVAVGWP
jgi:hypothetical protein